MEDKKRRVFDISIELFQEYGYQKTTIRDICSRAKISHSTFYALYGDKAGILRELYYHLMKDGSMRLAATPEHLANPYQAICDHFVFLSTILDRFGKDLAREFTRQSPMIIATERDQQGNLSSGYSIALFLQRAINAGTLPPDTDPWRIEAYLVAGISGVRYYWLNISDEPSMLEVCRILLPMIFSTVTDTPMVIRDYVAEDAANERIMLSEHETTIS